MERDKLTEIYQKYYNDVYLYAFSLCQNSYLAEEIVSDTFYKAFLAIEADGNTIKFWLLRVCKNCFIDRMRRNKWKDGRSIEEIPEEVSQEKDPLNCILKVEKNMKLYQAILDLPDAYREIVILFYFQNFSVFEISKLLKKNTGAIRMGLVRARQQLQAYLKEEG